MAEFAGRLVLRPDFTEEDAYETAWDLNWDLTHYRKPDGDSLVHIWLAKKRDVEVHLVDDRLVGLRYFTLRGERGDEVARQLIDACALWAKEDALADIRAADGKRDKLTAIYAAALAAEEQDDEVVDALRAVARDSDPGIRQAVIVAAAYTQWPGLVELVREMSERETVDGVRGNARILLEGIRAETGGS